MKTFVPVTDLIRVEDYEIKTSGDWVSMTRKDNKSIVIQFKSTKVEELQIKRGLTSFELHYGNKEELRNEYITAFDTPYDAFMVGSLLDCGRLKLGEK